jgi:predicted transcriptional regulator
VEGETTYTVDEAAEILEETPQRVREMLATGELDGIPPGATLSGQWKVLLPASLSGAPDQGPPVEESPSEDKDEDPPADAVAEQFIGPPQGTTAPAEEPPETEELSRGDNAAVARQSPDPEGEVTTQQAARSLGISPRTVRWHIEQGNLVARPEGEGVNRTWLVSISSLQAFRDARRTAGEVPRGYRVPAKSVDIAAESGGEAIRVLAERLEDAAARAAEYRVRLELTEQASSTLRAELEESRRRQQEAERERDELRRELEALGGRRESPVTPGPSETPTEQPGGSQEAREATQSAAETLRGPEPRPTTGGPPEGLQRPAQPGRRRGALWRRVFGR